MKELFGKEQTNITEHIGNILKDSELDEKEVCEYFSHTNIHGATEAKTQVNVISI